MPQLIVLPFEYLSIIFLWNEQNRLSMQKTLSKEILLNEYFLLVTKYVLFVRAQLFKANDVVS